MICDSLVEVKKVAEEATLEYSCVICERSFATQRGLKQHQGRQHKAPALSSIPQMDGAADAVEAVSNVRFTFKSEYREEDIEYSIRKILPEDAVSSLVSRDRIGWTADHLCVLELEEVDHENFVWPDMNSSDEEVLRELERM